MISTRYLIVGGGMTGDAAVKGIREHDPVGSIVLVGSEQHAPYARPPLTKKLWAGGDEAKIWRGTHEAGADVRLGRRIVSLDLDERTAADDAGETYAWEKVLLATGGRPRTIPDSDGVVYFRTLDDYREVRARVHEGARAVVVGGGFIGSEIAASLAMNGCRVTMVFPETGIASRVLPRGPLRLRDRAVPRPRRRGPDRRDRGRGARPVGRHRLGTDARGRRRDRRLGHRPRRRSGDCGRSHGGQRNRRRRARPGRRS